MTGDSTAPPSQAPPGTELPRGSASQRGARGSSLAEARSQAEPGNEIGGHLGFGVGLRSVHFSHILRHWPVVDWFEIISENFIDSQGRPRYVLQQIAERYPIVMHGVSLSIGSTDPVNIEYLKKLKRLAREIDAKWISDHLCWTGIMGRNTHDLLHVPFTEETLRHVVERVRVVQDVLERPFVLESPSSYISFQDSSMDAWEFVTRMAADADCG